MAITLRETKGSKLTHNELDGNFIELDEGKIDAEILANNNTLLIRNAAGDLVEIVVDVSRIVGRLASGEIKALTMAEAKGLLAIGISDVSGLTAALAGKQPTITAGSGWSDPTGTGDKSTFATGSVTTENLAEFVKAMYEDLKAQGLLTA